MPTLYVTGDTSIEKLELFINESIQEYGKDLRFNLSPNLRVS